VLACVFIVAKKLTVLDGIPGLTLRQGMQAGVGSKAGEASRARLDLAAPSHSQPTPHQRGTPMSQAAEIVAQLETSHGYIRKMISIFEEEDAGFAPQPELYTVAGHIAHAADSVEWFVDGAFGKGWNMDFEGLIAAARAVESLDEAIAWLDRAFEKAIATFEAASDEDLAAPIPDERIMPGASRSAIVVPLVDHTAHHRGALTVYARLLGKVPGMMYE